MKRYIFIYSLLFFLTACVGRPAPTATPAPPAAIFIALFGQIFSPTPVGHEVQRIRLTPAGDSYTAQAEPFITGLDRPLDVTVGPDGALYVLDYVAGLVYRLAYAGPSQR